MVVFACFSNIMYSKTTDPKVDTVAAIKDFGGIAFAVTAMMAFGGVFGALSGIIRIIPPFMREHENRLYSPTSFYITSTIHHLPSQFLLILIYQFTFFWVIDIRQGWESFWKYYVTFLLTYVASAGFGDILSVAIRKMELISQLFSLLVVPLFIASGFIAAVKKMVFYFIGVSYISFFKFAF